MYRRVLEILLVSALEVWIRLSRALWRVTCHNQPADAVGPHLYAHWHGDELLLVPVFSGRGYGVMASRSRDGEVMAKLLGRLGYFVVRGSSSRGGAGGLKGLIDAVRLERRSAAVAVDGPRGPVFEVKPGILLLAQSTGLPIIPAAGVASREWKIKGAWNKGFYPKPLARCVVLFGEPFFVPAETSDTERKKLQLELGTRLIELKAQARKKLSDELSR